MFTAIAKTLEEQFVDKYSLHFRSKSERIFFAKKDLFFFKNRFFRRSSTLNRWIPVTTTLRKSCRQKTSLFCSFSEKNEHIFFPGKIYLKMFLPIRGRQFDKADETLLIMFENVRLRTESKFFNTFPEKSISSEHVRPNK